MALEECLDELAFGDGPIEDVELLQLSDLTPAEVDTLRQRWGIIRPERRRELVAALAERSHDSIQFDFSAVFLMCLGDGDEDIRETAIEGLWEKEDRVVIPPLVNAVAADPSAKVRASAAEALGKFALLAEEGKLHSRDSRKVFGALRQALDSTETDLEVRCRALEGIAYFNDGQVTDLISQAYRSSDPAVRRSALVAMGRNGYPDFLPIIMEEMQNSMADMRAEAATAAGHLGEESVTPHLVEMLNEDEPEVQIAAIKALGKIGGGRAKRALKECIASGDAFLQDAAEQALKQIEFEEDPLRSLFK